jgi:hypothetical protein
MWPVGNLLDSKLKYKLHETEHFDFSKLRQLRHLQQHQVHHRCLGISVDRINYFPFLVFDLPGWTLPQVLEFDWWRNQWLHLHPIHTAACCANYQITCGWFSYLQIIICCLEFAALALLSNTPVPISIKRKAKLQWESLNTEVFACLLSLSQRYLGFHYFFVVSIILPNWNPV